MNESPLLSPFVFIVKSRQIKSSSSVSLADMHLPEMQNLTPYRPTSAPCLQKHSLNMPKAQKNARASPCFQTNERVNECRASDYSDQLALLSSSSGHLLHN